MLIKDTVHVHIYYTTAINCMGDTVGLAYVESRKVSRRLKNLGMYLTWNTEGSRRWYSFL